jgi:hypothetical protein
MKLSNNGRVVVIDDKYEEVESLIKSLAKSGIPCFFFDGSLENLPVNPIMGIRFIFLDIELSDTTGTDDKSKASALAGRILKIIGESNGPYFIIFWTRHSEVIQKVLEYLKPKAPPIGFVDLEKPAIGASKDEWEIPNITNKLFAKLQDIGAFHLYVEWENILNLSGAKFVNDFSALVPFDSNAIAGRAKWSSGTSSLFYKLFEAFSGDSKILSSEMKFRSACALLNRSFSDTHQYMSQKELKLPQGFELKEGTIDISTISKINSALFLDTSIDQPVSTGSVFILDDAALLHDLKRGVFKKEKTPADVQLCFTILTPECDLSNDKCFRHFENGNEFYYHRIIYGLFLPFNNDLTGRCIDKGKEARFPAGPFWHNNDSIIMIFHFGTISQSHDLCNSNIPVFSLRRDLTFDLQSKAANHVNRLGNFLLK